jgi:hypothetical protein
MMDVEPPSRSHRPLIAVVFLVALFFVAVSIVYETSAKYYTGSSAGKTKSLLARLPMFNATTRFSIDQVTAGRAVYNVSGLQPRITVRPGTALRIGGWAVDDKAEAPAGGVRVYLDNGAPVSAQYGIKRNDVGKVLQDPKLSPSGFEALILTDGLAPGQHELTFQILNAASTGVYQVPKRIEFTIARGGDKQH